jgi:hypothetical protein
MLTSSEAAAELGITARRVLALIDAGRLPARRASPSEAAELLEEARIKSVPPAGIIVISEADLELVRDRRPGYPKGRPRKTHHGR